MWQCFLYDTVTGQLAEQIDVPSFSWDMSVNDSSFTTTPQRTLGDDSISSLEMPWSQVPGRNAFDRLNALAPYKRGIALFWKHAGEQGLGVPVLAGALGVRSSTRTSVSLPYVSMMGLLADRYLVHEKQFGSGPNHTSQGEWRFDNLSFRGLACEVVRACTSEKPGGDLPLDLPYLGEHGVHSLPVDDADNTGDGTKKTTRKNTADGYETTTVDGSTTTHTVVHVNETYRTVNNPTTRTWWAREKDGTRVGYHGRKYIRWRMVKKSKTTNHIRKIPTGRTQTSTTTTVRNLFDHAVKTVSTTTTVTTYDGSGKQTGTHSTTTTPVESIIPRTQASVYKDFNVSSHSCRQILQNIAAAQGGPDLQFRPYLADSQHIRFRLLGGSDADIYLNQEHVLSLDSSPIGGTLEDLKADWAAPYMRVYATGSGSDKAMTCDLAEDLTLVSRDDPWPLRETTYSDSDAYDWASLHAAAAGRLKANARPVVQFTGTLHADDTDSAGNLLHPLGSFWPGEMFHVAVEGFPDWPDGVYNLRLMEMSGDQSDKVSLKFDPIVVPTEGGSRTISMTTNVQTIKTTAGNGYTLPTGITAREADDG